MSKLVDPYEMPETRLTTTVPSSLGDSVKNYSATKISTIGESDQSPVLQESERDTNYLSLEEKISELEEKIIELKKDLNTLILKVFKLDGLVR